MVLPLIAVEHVGHWFYGGQWVGNCSVCKGVGHWVMLVINNQVIAQARGVGLLFRFIHFTTRQEGNLLFLLVH